jgi:hypothetical protein
MVHLPVLTLLSCTLGSFRSLLSLGMKVKREIPEYVPDLTGLNIGLQNPRKRLTGVDCAVGSLELGILDNGHQGVW